MPFLLFTLFFAHYSNILQDRKLQNKMTSSVFKPNALGKAKNELKFTLFTPTLIIFHFLLLFLVAIYA